MQTFDKFRDMVDAAGLRAVEHSAEHWQIIGGRFLVNYYPSRGTIYVAGMNEGRRHCTVEQAIASAQNPIRAKLYIAPGKRKNSYRNVRRRAWIKQNKRCHWCKTPIDESEVTADHRIPLSRGGSNGTDNIVAACAFCNQKRRNEMP